MPNLLQTGAAWLGQKLQASAGRSVTLEQGTTTVTGLTGVMTEFEYEVIDEGDFTTKLLSCDWVFVAADLSEFGTPPKLRSGAVVTEILNDCETKYEAMEIPGKQAVENKDSSGVLVTLHTKRVKK